MRVLQTIQQPLLTIIKQPHTAQCRRCMLMVATSEGSGTALTGLQMCCDGSRTLAMNGLAKRVRKTSLQMFVWTCVLRMVWITSIRSMIKTSTTMQYDQTAGGRPVGEQTFAKYYFKSGASKNIMAPTQLLARSILRAAPKLLRLRILSARTWVV